MTLSALIRLIGSKVGHLSGMHSAPRVLLYNLKGSIDVSLGNSVFLEGDLSLSNITEHKLLQVMSLG